MTGPATQAERVGTVVATAGGVYTVEDQDGERLDAFLRGRLKHRGDGGIDRAVVGDRVAFRLDGTQAVIEEVLPRRSLLVRRTRAGSRPRPVAANVDRMVVVMSLVRPRFRRDLLDRFLALGEACGVEPVVVLNKTDLVGEKDLAGEKAAGEKDRAGEGRESAGSEDGVESVGELRELYQGLGYEILLTSAVDGRGVEELRARLTGRLTVFAGPSGVGKSELLNALDPELRRRTRSVSTKGRRGRHTTVSAQLLDLEGDDRVVDTPGFTDAGLWGMDPDELAACFPELRELQGECRFRRCTHRHEPGCRVLEGLEGGEVDRGRYASYVSFREELEAGT